jgi:hypothetical protein
MQNQVIIQALELDGFFVTTHADTENFLEEIIYSKNGISGKVDPASDSDPVSIVMIANQDIETTRIAFIRIRKSLKNYFSES